MKNTSSISLAVGVSEFLLGSRQSMWGKIIRLPLRLISSSAVVPVLGGRMRGMRWIVGSSTHGCWLGTYESHKRSIFEQTVRVGSIVIDVGANVGFYTLLASRLVGISGKVIAIEPLPRNISYLRRHITLNKIDNVQIVEAAISDEVGESLFDDQKHSMAGRLSVDGTIHVRTATLDELISRDEIPLPSILKVDVEGAEHQVLSGARQLLALHMPIIFLATHSRSIHQTCCEYLGALGYELSPIGNRTIEHTDELVARPSLNARNSI